MNQMVDIMMPGAFIIPLIMFAIWLVFIGLSIYILILVIKALKLYINKNS